MPVPYFSAAGPVERTARKFWFGAMRALGVAPQITLAQGARFWIDPADFIDTTVALEGVWEAPQLEALAKIATLHKVDCFLDIGANTGFYSVMFAVKNLTPRIIAFEPDPGNYARLMANVNANNLGGRIECIQLALGDTASQVTLYEGAKHNRGESTIAVPEQTPREVTFTVQQARFDDLYTVAGQTLIVKIDVEGHEFHVIDGMEKTLRDNACYLQIEHYGERDEDLKGRLAALGYRYLYAEYIDLFFTNMRDV